MVANATQAGEQHGHESHTHLVILSVFFMLVVGAAFRHFFSKFPLPYTVILVIFGLCLGMMMDVESSSNFFVDSVNIFEGIDAHLILFGFLPPLLFESAFDMDLEVFWRVKWQVLILAGPGLVISTVVTGLILWSVIGWRLIDTLLLGSIISATDPVAVVALLKELGASKKIGHIIEGESLVNDGTAIVLFSVLVEAVSDSNFLENEGAGGLLGLFFRMSFGAVCVGLVFGFIVTRWIGRVFNDPFVEISLTLASAYLSFFLAEHWLGVSGVITVVTLGIFVNHKQHSISPEVHHFLHQFWGMTAFLANTLIFVLVGLKLFVGNSNVVGHPENWLWLFVVYGLANGVRGFAVGSLFSFLKRTGYGFTASEGVLLVWGGLRGAVALALAIVASDEYESIGDTETGEQLLFYVSGVVLLTLIFNAPTMPLLIKFVGLDRVPEAKLMELKGAKIHIDYAGERMISSLKKMQWFTATQWEEARKFLPQFRLPKTFLQLNEGAEHSLDDSLPLARSRFFKAIRRSYLNSNAQGLIGPHALAFLLNAVAEMGNNSTLMDEWSFLQEHVLELPWWLGASVCGMSISEVSSRRVQTPIVQICQFIMYSYLFPRCDVAYGFVRSRNEALELMQEVTHEPRIAQLLKEECSKSRKTAEAYLRALSHDFPAIVQAVQTSSAARQVLYQQRKAVNELVEEGILDEDDESRFTVTLETSIKKLLTAGPVIRGSTNQAVLKEIPWLAYCRAEVLKNLVRVAVKKTVKESQVVLERNAPPCLIIITDGTVGDGLYSGLGSGRAKSANDLIFGAGSVFGEMNILTGKRHTSSYVALSKSTTFFRIDRSAALLLQDKFPEFKENFLLTTSIKIARRILVEVAPFNHWPRSKLSLWLEDGHVTSHENPNGEVIYLRHVTVLVHGRAQRMNGSNNANTPFRGPVLLFGGDTTSSDEGVPFRVDGGSCLLHAPRNDGIVISDLVELAQTTELSPSQAMRTPKPMINRLRSEFADDESASELCRAAHRGDLKRVQQMVENEGISASSRDWDNRTALHVASSSGKYDVVRYLIERGTDVNATDHWGHTPLDAAITHSQDEVVTLLLDNGAAMGSYRTDDHAMLLCSMAKADDMVGIKRLLESGANINQADYDGRTALHVAASSGHFKLVEFLIVFGVDLTVKDRFGHTPLDDCIRNKHDDVVKLLREYGCAQSDNDQIVSSLLASVFTGDIAEVRRLLDSGSPATTSDFDKRSALHFACSAGHLDIARLLIENGADVNAQDKGGRTPLKEALVKEHDLIVRLLRDSGAETLQSTASNIHAMCAAAAVGNLPALERMVESGQDLNGTDYDKRTPLHIACSEGNADVVDFLLGSGARIDVVDRWGHTPLDEAQTSKQREVVSLLLAHGATDAVSDSSRRFATAEALYAASEGDMGQLKELVEEGFHVNSTNVDLRTVLHVGAAEGHINLCSSLVELGADVFAKDRWGNAPIDEAKMNGHGAVVEFLQVVQSKRSSEGGTMMRRLSRNTSVAMGLSRRSAGAVPRKLSAQKRTNSSMLLARRQANHEDRQEKLNRMRKMIQSHEQQQQQEQEQEHATSAMTAPLLGSMVYGSFKRNSRDTAWEPPALSKRSSENGKSTSPHDQATGVDSSDHELGSSSEVDMERDSADLSHPNTLDAKSPPTQP